MYAQVYKIQLKRNSVDYAAGWLKGLYFSIKDVYEVLTGDAMAVESMYIERGSQYDYLVVCSKKKDIPQKGEILNSLSAPARAAARDFICKSWESIIPLEHQFNNDWVSF